MPNFIKKILRGSPSGSLKEIAVWENSSDFLALGVNISKTVVDTTKVTIND